MAWLHTVLRHEAIAVARARRREGPGAELDVAEACADRVADSVAVDAVAEWRERYRFIQDGLAGLTDAQRVCLILQSARGELRADPPDHRLLAAQGRALGPRGPGEPAGVGGPARLGRRVRAAAAADRPRGRGRGDARASGARWRATSATAGPAGRCCATGASRTSGSPPWSRSRSSPPRPSRARPPDPSPALAWLDRIVGGATVRAGNAIQMAMELPSGALAKVGAGTAAVAVAGAAGAPLVADAVRPESPPAPVAAIERAASTTPATARAATTAPAIGGEGGAVRRPLAAGRHPPGRPARSRPRPGGPRARSCRRGRTRRRRRTATRAAAPSPAPAPAPVAADAGARRPPRPRPPSRSSSAREARPPHRRAGRAPRAGRRAGRRRGDRRRPLRLRRLGLGRPGRGSRRRSRRGPSGSCRRPPSTLPVPATSGR